MRVCFYFHFILVLPINVCNLKIESTCSESLSPIMMPLMHRAVWVLALDVGNLLTSQTLGQPYKNIH